MWTVRRLRVPLVCGAIALIGCNDLTRVSAPDITQPKSLFNAPGSIVLRDGAVAHFTQAFSLQALLSGMIADEFTDRTGGGYAADRRLVTATKSNFGYPYDLVSQARLDALTAIYALENYNPSPSDRISEMFSYLGYLESWLAEDMCSGVPLAIVVAGTPRSAPEMSRHQLLATALAHFDSAAHYSVAGDSMASLAMVGRARVLLDSGDFSEAATAANEVPSSYAFVPSFDSLRQQNQVFQQIVTNGQASVSDSEGRNGLPFVGAADPRVPTIAVGVSSYTGDAIYAFGGYSSAGSPIVLASGTEAQLILAETQLQPASAPGGPWLSTLNALRQQSGDTALVNHPLSDPGTADARVTLLFRERAFWLFATGHRQSDLRRLVRLYHRPTESVFPTGTYQNGSEQYGRDVSYLPFGEESNPAYSGCYDRNP